MKSIIGFYILLVVQISMDNNDHGKRAYSRGRPLGKAGGVAIVLDEVTWLRQLKSIRRYFVAKYTYSQI